MNRSNLYSVAHLSISFFLIFMSFSVAQIFQTSADYAKDGAFAVGILYSVFCVSNLALSSYLVRLIDLKAILIVTSITYGFFIASNIHFNRWILFLSSFLLGIGAALLWTAQGVYVTLSSIEYEEVNNLPPSSTRGFVNGLFSGIFQLNQSFGNLLVAYLFRLKLAQWIIFSILTTLAACGTLSLMFLRSMKMKKETNQRSIISSLTIMSDLPFFLLISTMCFSGLGQGFIFAAIPPLIVDKSRKFALFALYGFVNATSSFVFGKLSDLFPRRLLIFTIGALGYLSMLILLVTIWKPPIDQTRLEVFIIMTICFSIGDSIYMTQLFTVMALFYGKTRPSEAFACMKVFQAGMTAIAYVEHVYFRFSTQIFILLAVLSLSFVTLVYEHYGIKSLDTPTNSISGEKQIDDQNEKELDTQIPLKTSSTDV